MPECDPAAFPASALDTMPIGDVRDRPEIEVWAREIARELLAPVAA